MKASRTLLTNAEADGFIEAPYAIQIEWTEALADLVARHVDTLLQAQKEDLAQDATLEQSMVESLTVLMPPDTVVVLDFGDVDPHVNLDGTGLTGEQWDAMIDFELVELDAPIESDLVDTKQVEFARLNVYGKHIEFVIRLDNQKEVRSAYMRYDELYDEEVSEQDLAPISESDERPDRFMAGDVVRYIGEGDRRLEKGKDYVVLDSGLIAGKPMVPYLKIEGGGIKNPKDFRFKSSVEVE